MDPHLYRPQRSCGKVIFSQASVSHSVHGGSVCLSACWVCPPPEKTLPLPGSTPLRSTPRSTPPPPPPMVTAANGTHPTGMLSSLVCTHCQWSPGTINSTHTGTHLHTFAHISLLYFFRMKTTTVTSMVEALKWKDNLRSVSWKLECIFWNQTFADLDI